MEIDTTTFIALAGLFLLTEIGVSIFLAKAIGAQARKKGTHNRGPIIAVGNMLMALITVGMAWWLLMVR